MARIVASAGTDIRGGRTKRVFIPTPASSGGGVFSPLDLSPTLWLDASDTATIDDSTSTPDVDQWDDKSGNGYHVVQGTATRKPHTGGSVNSLNSIVFDGSDDYLQYTHGSQLFSGASGDLFVVSKSALAGSPPNAVVSFQRDASGGDHIRFLSARVSSGTGLSMHLLFRQWVTTLAALDGSTPTAIATRLLNFRSTGSEYVFKMDGSDETETVLAGSNGGFWITDLDNPSLQTSVTIGALEQASPSFLFEGDICEVIYFDGSNLSAGDLASLETYLKDKWGI